MNKTELAIMEHLAQLDEAQQGEILEHTRQLVNQKINQGTTQPNLKAWLESAIRLHAELQKIYGPDYVFNTQAILDEIRDEESE